MLANSPSEFEHTGHVRPIYYERKRPPTVFSSRGLEIHHSYSNMWEKIRETVLDGRLFAKSNTLFVRLDCEVAERDVVYWIGVSLGRNLTTGDWYRQDASKLLQARRPAFFQRAYPAFTGFQKIYVETPRQHLLPLHPTSVPITDNQTSVLSTYNRSMLIGLHWLITECVSALFWILCISELHYRLGFSGPNTLLSWACLTGSWHLQGQDSIVLICFLVSGLCGCDFDLSSYRSGSSAVLCLLPMRYLQVLFDMLEWKSTTFQR